MSAAREAMREQDRALLVEGYVDCLMAHQHGFTETVAALGTSFTAAQLALLRRFCDEVITFFDADAAGQKAAERAEELLEPSGGGALWGINRAGTFDRAESFRVRVALLPAGHDPDTFLRAARGRGLRRAPDRARAACSPTPSIAPSADPSDTTGPRGPRQHLRPGGAACWPRSATPTRRRRSRARLRSKLGVDPTQLWIESQRLQSALRPRPGAAAGTASPTLQPGQFETDLVTLLLVRAGRPRRALLSLVEAADVHRQGTLAIWCALQQRAGRRPRSLLAEVEAAGRRAISWPRS